MFFGLCMPLLLIWFAMASSPIHKLWIWLPAGSAGKVVDAAFLKFLKVCEGFCALTTQQTFHKSFYNTLHRLLISFAFFSTTRFVARLAAALALAKEPAAPANDWSLSALCSGCSTKSYFKLPGCLLKVELWKWSCTQVEGMLGPQSIIIPLHRIVIHLAYFGNPV